MLILFEKLGTVAYFRFYGKTNQVELADYLNCPVVTSAGHGDAIPYDYKLNAGQMGPRGNPVATKLMKEADVILALGTRLGFNSTFYSYDNINKKAKIIQIELEKKMIGRYFPVAAGIYGDAATIADQLYKEIKKQKTVLPTTVAELHGLLVDTSKMQISLPRDKLVKAIGLIDSMYGKTSTTLHDLQSLLGLLNFCTKR